MVSAVRACYGLAIMRVNWRSMRQAKAKLRSTTRRRGNGTTKATLRR